MIFTRMIERAKWPDEPDHVLMADVLGDVRTSENKLSMWAIPSEEGLVEAALALASARDKIRKISILWFPAEHLRDAGWKVDKSKGRTGYRPMQDSHFDVVSIPASGLHELADLLNRRVQGAHFRTFTKKDVERSLRRALETGDIDLDALNGSLRQTLET